MVSFNDRRFGGGGDEDDSGTPTELGSTAAWDLTAAQMSGDQARARRSLAYVMALVQSGRVSSDDLGMDPIGQNLGSAVSQTGAREYMVAHDMGLPQHQ